MRKPKNHSPLMAENGIKKAQCVAAIVQELNTIEESTNGSFLPNALLVPHSLINRNGVVLYASRHLSKLTNKDLDTSDNSLLDYLHVQDRVTLLHALSQAGESGDAQTVELRIMQSAQSTKWVDVKVQAIHASDCEAPLFLATFDDISRRKNMQEQLESAKVEAEEISSAKSTFLANTSHELRTPLNAILGFSDLLTSKISSNLSEDQRFEYISLIHQSADHLLSVLNGILDMSKIESGKYEIIAERFDLASNLSSTVAMMSGQALASDIKLQTYGFEEMPEIVADPKAVRQVLFNLISNAIKFSNSGETVTIGAERTARYIKLIVKDNGIGISKEHLKNLGEAFFQADSKYDRKYEGTGLGLSVVKGLIELHGGGLEFKSERNKGTTAVVFLPINGKSGRRVPCMEATNKITQIQPGEDEQNFNITRSVG